MTTTLKRSELSRTYKVGQEITLNSGFVGIVSYIGKKSNYDIRSENGLEGQPTLEGTKGWLGEHRIIPNDWEAIYTGEVHEAEILEVGDKGFKTVNRKCPKAGKMLNGIIEKAKDEGYSGVIFKHETGETRFEFNKIRVQKAEAAEPKEELVEPIPGEMFEGVLIPDEVELLGEFLDEDEEEILRESYGEARIPREGSARTERVYEVSGYAWGASKDKVDSQFVIARTKKEAEEKSSLFPITFSKWRKDIQPEELRENGNGAL